MPSPFALSRSMTLFSAVLLAACGGSPGGNAGGGAPAAPAVPPAPATTLSVSVSSLALAARNLAALPAAIPGNARSLTVTNVGVESALAVALDPALVLPVGTSVSANTCAGTLAPAASCTITVTPGSVATTVPVTLTIRGSNTNTLAPTVQVLAYRTTYQGGYVFALDDSTPSTGSVGGKLIARSEASAGGPWSPDFQITLADSLTQGDQNTSAVLATYSDPMAYPAAAVAARACADYSDSGYTDWYLPAICEMGYDQTGSGSGCGTAAAPAQQNVQTSLVDSNLVGGSPGVFWSSSQSAPGGGSVWSHRFSAVGTSYQVPDSKLMSYRLLCVRAITH